MENPLDFLDDLIKKARAAGAQLADAVLFHGASLTTRVRLGKADHVERSESLDLGLRVLMGQRQAIVSTADVRPASLDTLIERAIAMAHIVPEDPFAGLADSSDLAAHFPDLNMNDPAEPSTEALMNMARRAEESARAVQGVTNISAAEASWGKTAIVLATSAGFRSAYTKTGHSSYVSAVAGAEGAMETDYEATHALHAADLLSPEIVGRIAGERAVQRLKSRQVPTQKVPVMFDPRVSNTLVSHFLGAINGASVVRGTSFLKDKLNQSLFPEMVTIVDNPLLQRGRRSYPFDGEGVQPKARNLIDQGKLTTWLMDSRTARQLKMRSTGHASRGASAPPSPSASNVFMSAGVLSPQELMADISQGLYVTQIMGPGVNGITGDYSRGAAGFWIERGQIAYPVGGITIASHLIDMYRHITPANDLVVRYGIDAPTLRVDGMTVGGTS